ncbi:Pectin lyase 1 [Paramyrothecium foliicola]|nr:Pectin lyase 1 [Paramyrothecium foliicola]
MRSAFAISAALAACVPYVSAAATGEAEGFAAGVTGGGSAPDVFPTSTDELIEYLGDSEPRNIVLTKEFDFIGTEGSATETGCAPWGTGTGCQLAINHGDWCNREQPDAPKVDSITYDKAGITGITVGSNKSLVGKGSSGVIRGKGLRIRGGVSNIIIQNVHITELNHKYVWGGDAIDLDDADMVWIDHVTTSKIGRQHYVAGNGPSGRVTISNSEIDGRTDFSATCNGHHYWNMLLIGSNDQITLKNNYFHDVSGRAPKVGGSTVMHAVNNVWTDVAGQAFETESGAKILIEGNVFDNVKTPIKEGSGQLLAINAGDSGEQCDSALERLCEANSLSGSGPMSADDAGVLSSIKAPATAAPAEEIKNSVIQSAGIATALPFMGLILLGPIPLAIVAIAIALLRPAAEQVTAARSLVSGRNNTVLFITPEASGLSNIHVAATSALLEHYPMTEVHFASFPRLRKKVDRISAAAVAKTPAAKPVVWHELPGADMTEAALRRWNNFDGLVVPPGFAGFKKTLADISVVTIPWEQEEHWAIYTRLLEIIQTVDPAVVILDTFFQPACDLTANLDRRFVFLSPNTLAELFASDQPRAAQFWRYPAMATGYPFPVPLKLIPHNILFQLRLIWGLVNNPDLNRMRDYLTQKGVKDAINLRFGAEGVPSFMATLPEANLPLEVYRDGTKFFGPVVVETAPAEEQDPDLALWLKRAPTMLINLGSMFQFSRERAEAMIGALTIVLADMQDVQVLWKFRKAGNYSDEVFEPLQGYINNGRLRIETWLKADPVSLLRTGDITVSVHHGGAGCYHEAVLTGVPQIILPAWLDLYGIAQTAEYVGVGVWPGKETAPVWDSRVLAKSFMEVLVGELGKSMRMKAIALAETARSYGGRDSAAREIARLATLDETVPKA